MKMQLGLVAIATMITMGSAQAEMAKRTRTTTQTTSDYNYAQPGSPDYVPNYHPIPDQQEQQSITQETTVHEDQTLRDERFSITPQVGALSFTNRNNAYTSRAMAGVGLNFNLVPLLASVDNRDLYLGVTTGGLFSHSGNESGNFFGNNSGTSDGSNVIIIPADAKIGFNLTPGFRMSAHGGGNIVYRSVASAINLGYESSNANDSVWRIYPNVGADADVQVGKNISLSLRPDLTFTTGTTLFAATLGATIMAL